MAKKSISNTFTVNVVVDGENGKDGKNYYYGGEWDTSRQDTFKATDFETPYFTVKKNVGTQQETEEKWVYVGENFGGENGWTITTISQNKCTPSGGVPSDNGNWEIMVTDFKYLISEAIFSTFAKLGSGIFNGDWMMSQYGTINGAASTNYQSFDVEHPNDNDETNFIPNYAVDLLNGRAYLNSAVFRGNIYTPTFEISDMDDIRAWHNINAQQSPNVWYMIKPELLLNNTNILYTYTPMGTYYLPNNYTMWAQTYDMSQFDGCEVRIVNSSDGIMAISGLTVRDGQTSVTIKTNGYGGVSLYPCDVAVIRCVHMNISGTYDYRWVLMSHSSNYN